MVNDEEFQKSAWLSVKDIQQWAMEEVMNSTKAHELRVRDATEIAMAYARGELTPQEATERLILHDRRWGEALPGTHLFPGSTDDQLLASIDSARDAKRGNFQNRVRRKSETGPSKE